jgi:hypothetical protein
MANVLAYIAVCDDCLFVHANGETGNESPDREPWGLLPSADVAMDCGDDDENCGFSWHACDACGSQLGGTRHPMAVFGWGE